jgi:hypothetical protein
MNPRKSIRRALAITAGGAAIASAFFVAETAGAPHTRPGERTKAAANARSAANTGRSTDRRSAVDTRAATTGRSTGARACESTDLRISRGPIDAGAGQRNSTLDFRTIDGTTCELSDNLTGFHFLRGDGSKLPTKVQKTGDPSDSVVLRPGAVAHLDLQWTMIGDTRFTPRMLSFTVPADEGRDTVAWGTASVGGSGHLKVGKLHM